MIYKISTKKDDFLESIFKESFDALNVFYGINWKHHIPKIIIVDDRKTINLLKGEVTEDWLIGWSEGKTIYVLNKDHLEKESNHTYDAHTYSAFIKHELSHSFYDILSNGHQKPIWLNEGFAIYTGGQNKFKEKPAEFSKFLEFYEHGGKEIYTEAGFFVQGLVEKFGKQKLLDFVKNLKNIKTKEEFEQFFTKEYGFNLTYSEINSQKLI
jgi:hypothetical protein